ncbi:MAG: hypothetical protein IJZ46_03735 [Bacilli bacterium]|nr:hypothetical protein [Bacilli bacterium]
MFLYENNKEFIDIYKLEPKLEEISKYKKSEVDKIPEEERMWRAITSGNKLLEGENDIIDYYDLNRTIITFYEKSFQYFMKSNNKTKNSELLNSYYTSNSPHKLFKVKNYDKCKYIILLQNEYENILNHDREYVMDGIMSVTKSLYLLEALLNRRFDLIGDNDIEEQLRLFNIVYYGRINTEILQNICGYELLTDSYEEIIDRVNSNKKVLNKVKKIIG